MINDKQGRILIATADPAQTALEQSIVQAGFTTRRVGDAIRMLRLLEREHIDVLILDHQLPDSNALELCGQLRQRGIDTPIVLLTLREADCERVKALEAGADDCVVKPCNAAELIARMRAILRRTRRPAGAPENIGLPVQLGPYQLDLTHRLLKKGDITVSLTTGDFALLSALARNPGQPMSRDQLKAVVSKRAYTAEDRSIDVRIARLRRLLESNAAQPRYLQTVWGFGYVMVPGN
jgi:DNA-binding response OmpR family regulator